MAEKRTACIKGPTLVLSVTGRQPGSLNGYKPTNPWHISLPPHVINFVDLGLGNGSVQHTCCTCTEGKALPAYTNTGKRLGQKMKRTGGLYAWRTTSPTQRVGFFRSGSRKSRKKLNNNTRHISIHFHVLTRQMHVLEHKAQSHEYEGIARFS